MNNGKISKFQYKKLIRFRLTTRPFIRIVKAVVVSIAVITVADASAVSALELAR